VTLWHKQKLIFFLIQEFGWITIAIMFKTIT